MGERGECASQVIKHLPDTNIVTYMITHRPPRARGIFNRHHDCMAISAVTLAKRIHARKRVLTPPEI
jgi:hypothetical protein